MAMASDEGNEDVSVTTNDITNSLLLEISRQFNGSIVQRINVMAGNVGARFVRSAQPGTADIVGMIAPSGRFLAIEVKRPGDVLSDAQFSFLRAVQCGGGIALVVGRSGMRKLPDGVACCETVERAMRVISLALIERG